MIKHSEKKHNKTKNMLIIYIYYYIITRTVNYESISGRASK